MTKTDNISNPSEIGCGGLKENDETSTKIMELT